MRLTARIELDEIIAFLGDLFPLDIHLPAPDAEEGGRIRVHEAHSWALRPGEGVHLVTGAHLYWPLPLLRDGVSVAPVSLLLVPCIEARGAESALVFRVIVEEISFSLLPTAVESHVASRITSALEKAGVEVAWQYTDTLRVQIDLPSEVHPPQQFQLGAHPASLEVGEKAIEIYASLALRFARREES